MSKKPQPQPQPRTPAQIQENVLSTFAYHCGVIMVEDHLNGFGLGCGDVEVFCTMKIVQRSEDGNAAWDQVEVNGQRVGNRSAAREAYVKLCAPVIAAAFAAK